MTEEAPDIHALAGAYTLDALEPEQAAAFERHLESCEPCREELRSFGAAVAAMADDVAVAPPERMRASVLSAISSVRPLPPVVPVDELAVRRTRRASTWLMVAAAVLGVAMVGAAWRSVTLQDQVTQLTASAADLNAVLTAPDAITVTGSADTGARAAVVVSQARGEAVLVTEGLAPAPPGQTYQVWYITPGGTMASAGFLPQGEHAAALLNGDPGTAAVIGVTLEPEGGSAQPTTTPVLALELPATT
ncbi:MAG: anti-sigma factor [Actinomycetota bacterium]|nr:anti-sigma factor [Actinomycetota bacterium]